MIITRSKKTVQQAAEYMGLSLDGKKNVQLEDDSCNLSLTCSAPTGEPRHYNSKTNTGGRRIIGFIYADFLKK